MKKYGFRTITAVIMAIGITGGTLGVAPASANYVESCYEQNCTVWFSYTGGLQQWHPPINARNMTFQVSGGQGGKSGGLGGRVTGTLNQIPSTLYIGVAGAGSIGQGAAGGFNGGGQAGSGSNNEGSGGGSSDLRLGTSVETRIVVAGGGGGRGAGITPTASPGGGLTAAAGKDGQGRGGAGGSQTSGGIGGAANGSGTSGSAGSLLTGGTGGSSNLYGGGGGGGGYFGGGGGGSDTDSSANDAGAGGGGSSFTDPLHTSNITHIPGVKSGNGMVMIEYQLVPLFESISTPSQLSNQSTVKFDFELSDPFPGFAASHIEIVGAPDTCRPGILTGEGKSYSYTVTECLDGEVGITIRANSILDQRYTGPETDKHSPLVRIDKTSPEFSRITQENFELTIPISEPVIEFSPQNYTFASDNKHCQIESITLDLGNTWLATLAGCEDSNFSFTIYPHSFYDLAGNTGPAQQVTYEVFIPQTEATLDQVEESAANAPIESDGPTSPENQAVRPEVSPDLIEDSEVFVPSRERSQASQAVIKASSGAESVDSNLGWAVGLAIAGVLLLVGGFSMRRRRISDLLVG